VPRLTDMTGIFACCDESSAHLRPFKKRPPLLSVEQSPASVTAPTRRAAQSTAPARIRCKGFQVLIRIEKVLSEIVWAYYTIFGPPVCYAQMGECIGLVGCVSELKDAG